jgi:hypothetical protein
VICESRKVPRFVWAGAALMSVLILILVFAGAWLARVNDASERDLCRAVVNARDDNRAMWLYLIEQNPDSPELPEFVIELDRRLPPLDMEDC